MHFQFEVFPTLPAGPTSMPAPTAEFGPVELLRQLLEVQREQLGLLRTSAAAHDTGSRWRAFLARWQDDFPGLPAACRHALPALERAYITLIHDLTEQLRQQGSDALENDFALSEFLDRYGLRLGQLGTILSLVGPLAEAAGTQSESS
jgi:hypothetical protein